MELFHYAEKELLIARGVLTNSISRKAAYIPDASSVSYIRELNQRIINLLQDEKYEITPLELTRYPETR